MHPRIGDPRAPVVELGIEIVEIAEGSGQKEILPHVAIGPFDLALRLGPVRPAGARHGACFPAAVSKRRSKGWTRGGRAARRKSVTTVAARIAPLLQLAQEPLARQVGPGVDPGAQVVLERRDHPRLRRARAVGRWRDADFEVLAHRLAVHAELARDGRNAEPLPFQIVDQDDLSQCNHLPAPPFAGQQVGCFRRRRSAGGMPPADRRTGAQTGDFSNGTSGEITLGSYTLSVMRLPRTVDGLFRASDCSTMKRSARSLTVGAVRAICRSWLGSAPLRTEARKSWASLRAR